MVSTHPKNTSRNGSLPPNRGENKKKCLKPPPRTHQQQSLAGDLSKLPFVFSPELAACSCDDAPRHPLSCYLTGNVETLTNLQSVRRTCSNQYECFCRRAILLDLPPQPSMKKWRFRLIGIPAPKNGSCHPAGDDYCILDGGVEPEQSNAIGFNPQE